MADSNVSRYLVRNRGGFFESAQSRSLWRALPRIPSFGLAATCNHYRHYPKAPAEELKARLIAMSPENHSKVFREILVTLKPVFVSREPNSSKFGYHVFSVPMQDALAICQAVNEREANSIFYSSNHFNAVDSYITRETSDLKAFLDFLSPCCSSLLSSISISFPILQAEQGQSQEPKLSPVGMQCLKLLQTSCTKLKTLELLVQPSHSFGLARNAPIDLRLKDSLSRVNEELRRISSLEKVIVRCFGNLDPEVEKLMKGFDWEVDTDQCKPY
ncbi:hypothetical protein FOXB_16900 [Fusarium oxysporum f. sp. conglutinans Fo5176]|uniref:Uncharacterized protein n=1 Tax=Fusarium oxysporum (strain Fo5176) TaxID=660025 RepID=F9GE16_FUSOF|nr:hypothetical protein FOXB_16900 [Fusarium oxysporum f. sp. conglutinans Fo5176]